MPAKPNAPRPSGPAPRRRLSAQDAIFVHAETSSMPMHTLGTMILDPSTLPEGNFDYEHVCRTMERRIHLSPPWRQRLLEMPFALDQPIFVDDPDFRVEEHVHRAALPSPGSLRELADFVADVAGRPLDRSRPLWEMWIVEGLEDERLALVMKLHHCMSDGASGASQMDTLLDLAPDAVPPAPEREWDPAPLPSRLALARETLRPSLPNPLRLARLLYDTGRGLYDRTRAQREIEREGGPVSPLMEGAPETRFSGAITSRRAVAFASAPLDAIKFIKNTFGVTVNDAVLAACALSLRRYLEAHDDLPDAPLLCGVPVDLKSAEEKQEFSNRVSAMVVKLPTHLGDPEEVIHAVHAETSAAKRLFQAVDGDLTAGWSQLAPPALVMLGARLFSALDLADWINTPLNCLVSNMQGPPIPLYWGGARVLAIYPMGPVAEGSGINITVLSNMGRLDFGVLACRDTVPGVQGIAEGFSQAVAELETVAHKRAAAEEPAVAREA